MPVCGTHGGPEAGRAAGQSAVHEHRQVACAPHSLRALVSSDTFSVVGVDCGLLAGSEPILCAVHRARRAGKVHSPCKTDNPAVEGLRKASQTSMGGSVLMKVQWGCIGLYQGLCLRLSKVLCGFGFWRLWVSGI